MYKFAGCSFQSGNRSDSEHTHLVNESHVDRFRMTLLRGTQTVAISLALTLCIASPVMAEALVPTLDRVKSEQTTFLDSAHSSYSLTELTDGTAVPEGSITVKIAEKTYYYTPTENAEVLKTLASTGSAALVETTKDKALYTVGDKYYTYNTEKLKDSGYSLKEATSADEPNTIILYDKETVIKYYDPKTGEEVAAGDRQPDIEYREVQTIQTTPKYYTVNLNKTQYGNTKGTTTLTYGWEKNADKGNLEFKQDPQKPVGQKITYSYNPDKFTQKVENQTINDSVKDPTGTSYRKPYMLDSGVGLNNPEGTKISIDNVLYKDNTVTGTLESSTSSSKYAQVSGGAVYNAGDITSITGAFINNGVEATSIRT